MTIVKFSLQAALLLCFNWRFSVTVKACYNKAKEAGKTSFVVQFYKECWVSNDNEKFRDFGQATNCYNGAIGLIGPTTSTRYVCKVRVNYLISVNGQKLAVICKFAKKMFFQI